MQEEIKEILEYVLSLTYGNENAIKGISEVKDYITNLQEENASKDYTIKEFMKANNQLQGEKEQLNSLVNSCQEEIRKLKEQCKEWKENHKAVCIQRDNILDNIVKNTEERIDYKSRNEKAIEYMKLIEMDKTDKYIPIRDYNEYKKLLNILQGVDKE